MSRHTHAPIRRFAVVAAPVVAIGFLSGPAAVAASDSGDVDVVNTETVQVKLDADGKVGTERVYEQLALTGDGTVTLDNPISNNRLRNLDGFQGFDVENGEQKVRTTVRGSERFRTVSNYTKSLPLQVTVRYFLDGRPVSAHDVVGKSGELEVRYRVENVTGREQQVTYTDGKGKEVTEKSEVVIPMVGSLTTTAPASFTDVSSGEANIAGDGKGGTKMSFTMTLFPPIGSPTAEFGYKAQVSDGSVPKASISALPVDPLQSPSFKGGAASYKGGATTGATLTAGATQIDENLLRLRDGASQLLSGLIQLRDGAGDLSDGLNDRAVPGARKAANGAGQIADGAGQLDDGAERAAKGAGDLDAGAKKLEKGAKALDDGLETAGSKAPQLVDGLEKVSAGLDQVDAGLAKLGKDVGEGGQKLRAGVNQLQAGIGTKSDGQADGTLLGGVNALSTGLSAKIVPGLNQILSGIPESKGKLQCAELVLRDLTSDNAARNTPSACSEQAAIISSLPALNPATYGFVLNSVADGLKDGQDGLIRPNGGTSRKPTLQEGVTDIRDGLTGQVLPGLAKIGCGLDNTYISQCTNKSGLLQGLDLLDAGISQLTSGVVKGVGTNEDVPADKTLRGGVNGLQDGNAQIVAGGESLLDGLGKLGDGAGQLADGTGTLSAGTGRLADGNEKLADGAGRLATGASKLDSGLFTLVDGLVNAGDGALKISDGLGTASDGAPKLVDGAEELSTKGTKKLVEAGENTAADFGLKYALIEAGSARAGDAMAYGAPEGAAGMTAYSYDLAGADGEGTRNAMRGGAAALVFAAAGGIALLRRRFLA